MSDSFLTPRLWLTRLFCQWDFFRQEYWSRLPFPSWGISLIQGLNLYVLLGRQILYHWATRYHLERNLYPCVVPGVLWLGLSVWSLITWLWWPAKLWKVVAEKKTPGFLASGGEECNPGPETRLDHSELLCNKVLLKYKGDRESFWHRYQKGTERVPPC